MAIAAVLPAMNGEKALHPFFTKVNGQHEPSGPNSGDESEWGSGIDGAQDEAVKEQKPAKKRKSKESSNGGSKTQRTLDQIVNPPPAIEAVRKFDGREIPNSCSSDLLSTSPRKKRRTSPIEPVAELQEDAFSASGTAGDSVATPPRQSSPRVVIPASSPLPVTTAVPVSSPPPTAPKKMLRLNASGKFSSPPSNKPKDAGRENVEPAIDVPKRRGRPRKSKEVQQAETQHNVVIIKYANEGDKGDRIDRILNGKERIQNETKTTPKKQRTPRKPGPAKPTHPFFTGKPKDQPAAPKQESPRKESAATPGKLKKHTKSLDRSKIASKPDIWNSSLLKDRLMMKHPGAMEPLWPSREQAHVRGLNGDEVTTSDVHSSWRKRKQKAMKKDLAADESILSRFASRLMVEEEGQLRDDMFREPHPSLLIPRKLLISGQEILDHSSRELGIPGFDDGIDELALPTSTPQNMHPAIEHIRQRIPNSLTAFDELTGEHYSWTQKYAPATAAEVLQPNREMETLKSWLTSLTITAVESALGKESRQSPKPESKPKKKRRRKNKDMDDFLVDSDEEMHDMNELTDPEDEPGMLPIARKGTKSTIQTATDGAKLSNAVLLTGPHGCGKTAAAYAVARELGFKVFEISSSEKRSGKDVLERVGDMAENHLVKHHGTESGNTSAAEEPSRNEEAFQKDLASGRQGKMDAFFKPKATAVRTSPKKQQPKPKVKAIEQLQQAVKKAPKDQQQSLILLEEVDILFKEDKEFWNTVLKLITTSKRPFIMTCNDEDLVPLQAMTLHAILRFSPPAIDLAADYLLTTAASEGHLLKRDAVLSLYRAKAFDLRATINELNFWCQMGIGDPRIGLNWIYQRYPPGTDLDQHGRRLRVVSEGSYQRGIGHLPDMRLSEEDQALWKFEAFEEDPLVSVTWKDLASTPDMLPTLKQYESSAAALSAADVYTLYRETAALDITQPPMADKARAQYIEGMRLLQTDEAVRYDTFTEELAIASSIIAYRDAGLPISMMNTSASEAQETPSERLTRRDFACFDAIAVPNETMLSSNQGLSQSAFDGPLGTIAIDLAPYVRSVLQHEAALSDQHHKLNGILGEGAPGNKRLRTTRAARSALQGSQRSLTRREKWFTTNLDVGAVLATGGREWPKATASVDEFQCREGTETPSPSAEST